MTPEEFKKRMVRAVREAGGDHERSHSAMDDLMCEVLVSLGYGDGVEVFRKQEKWYA